MELIILDMILLGQKLQVQPIAKKNVPKMPRVTTGPMLELGLLVI